MSEGPATPELDLLLLRLDAPLMSFGGVRVDENNVTDDFPGQAMLTGLLANALGYHHREARTLGRLQERLRYAVRRDRRGVRLVDFQTVDLGQDHLLGTWTTHGRPAGRKGGSAKTGTHIRKRHYWAGAVYTVAIGLSPADETPTIEDLERAVIEPERPLFLGRKACLPALPLYVSRLRASSLRAALALAPQAENAHAEDGTFAAWWPDSEGPPPDGKGLRVPVTDQRDWENQIHAGRRFVWRASIPAAEVSGHA